MISLVFVFAKYSNVYLLDHLRRFQSDPITILNAKHINNTRVDNFGTAVSRMRIDTYKVTFGATFQVKYLSNIKVRAERERPKFENTISRGLAMCK